jgi:hypothetical protein
MGGHWIEAEFTGGNVILTAENGNTSDPIGYVAGNDVNIRVCYPGLDDPNGQLTGEIMDGSWADSLTMCEGAVAPIEGGYYARLENLGGTVAEFDDFDWNEHYETNSDCDCCCCSCDLKSLPDTLTLTVVGSGTGCSSNTITLTRNRDCVSEWESAAAQLPYGATYTLQCRSSATPCVFECDFSLFNDSGEDEGCAIGDGWEWDWVGDAWEKESTTCTCDPLSITFPQDGPFDDPENCTCEGTHTFTVTV